MVVLVPRMRTLGVRLSKEEYSSLERFCIESGARSMSDLARAAIFSFVYRGLQETAPGPAVDENSARVRELQRRIEMLSAELALFKAGGKTGG